MTLAVINKDLTQDAAVEVTGATLSRARAMRLTAPSISAMSGVALGGAMIGADGSWKGGHADPVRIKDGKVQLDVPACSAALITLTA
jgi:hypothetical protein